MIPSPPLTVPGNSLAALVNTSPKVPANTRATGYASNKKGDKRTSEQRSADDELMKIAQQRFDQVCRYESDWRNAARKELNFLAGQHWDAKMLQDRAGRPSLVFDKIGPAIDMVVNDARQSPPEARISPVGSGADKYTAEIIQGLIRNIDNDSSADIAYLTAYEHAVAAGRGWWYVDFEWESEDPGPLAFQQKITINRIANPFSVYPDPAADDYCYSDMRFCFVTEDLDHDVFDELYPNAAATSANFEAPGDHIRNEWYPNGAIRVAEYWWVETTEEYISLLPSGQVVPWHEVPDRVIPINTRRVDKRRVRGAKISGYDILEWEHPGKWIPLVACIGKEIIRDNKRELRGMIRPAMDANLSYDYMRSKQVEAVALTPLAPWLAAEGQIEGYEQQYADANKKNFNVLKYKVIDSEGQRVPPPARITVAPDIQAITQGVEFADKDIQSTLSTYPSSLGAPSPESSGRAILARQREGDNAHFNYHDNLARAIRQTGRVVLDLMPHVYNEQRMITIFDPDGKSRMVPINAVHLDKGVKRIFNLADGTARYDVVIGSGPSYATRRQQGTDAFMQLFTAAPQIMGRAIDLGIRAMDIPNGEEIADRVRPPDVAAEQDDDGQVQLPPQVQKAFQQQGQMIQALTQTVHKLSEMLETKVLELESKERIALRSEIGGIIQAEIKARTAESGKLADVELAGVRGQLDALHTGISLDQEAEQMAMAAQGQPGGQQPGAGAQLTQ